MKTGTKYFGARGVGALLIALTSVMAFSQIVDGQAQEATQAQPAQPQKQKLLMPLADPDRGRQLFAYKGCAICHSVNGVGGKGAAALDAPPDNPYIDVMDFVARMWRGAYAMTKYQETEIGYQIELSGDEIADLAAFLYNKPAQASFSADDIPDIMKDWIIDQPYWEEDTWPEEYP